jgi:hypothetical protein
MKSLPLCALLVSSSLPVSAAIIHSGEQNLSVSSIDLEGIYINMTTGQVVEVWPDDFEEAAWINLTLGGNGIFNSDYLRPWASVPDGYDPDTPGHFYVNLSPGEILDSSSPFVVEGYASTSHIGLSGEPGMFVLDEPGYLGFAFQNEPGGDPHYGWLQFIPSNGGTGTIVDWAYESTPGQSIEVGAVPEPATGVLLIGTLGLAARRRRATV